MSSGLMMILVAVLGFVAVGALGLALVGDSGDAKTSKRIQALATPAHSERGRQKRQQDAAGLRRKQILQNLKAQEKQERKAKLTLQARLTQAGLSLSLRDFWIGSAALALTAGVTAMLFRAGPLISIGVAFAFGFGAPQWLITMLAKRRVKAFTEEFPNAIDVIVRGIKSGLPVNDCLRIIAAEASEPLKSEFQKLVDNVNVGLGTDMAMEKMYGRMPTAEVRFFAIVLSIQQKTGGNLAEALNNLSVVLRARKLMREKIKAMSGEAVASAVIIGSLPPAIMLLVTVTTPAYMAPLFNTDNGHIILLIGATLMGVGIFVMRRMINFKF
jgi:tight adherence protein B